MSQSKNTPDKRLNRVHATFTDDEVDSMDAWGFARKIRNRSDVVRALIRKGLEATEPVPPAAA